MSDETAALSDIEGLSLLPERSLLVQAQNFEPVGRHDPSPRQFDSFFAMAVSSRTITLLHKSTIYLLAFTEAAKLSSSFCDDTVNPVTPTVSPFSEQYLEY